MRRFRRSQRAEIEEVRTWIDNILEGQLELPDGVKAKLDQSRRELPQKPFDAAPELEAWLIQAADKPTTPLTKPDFAAGL